MSYEEWFNRFRRECDQLGVSAIPSHWNLRDCHAKRDNPELLAQEAGFWLSYAAPVPATPDRR